MKRIFSIFIILGLCAARVAAQNADNTVPIGFMNAVGLATKTDFQIDGRSLKPAGFSQGAYASSFGVTEGNHQFSFTNGTCEKISNAVAIKSGISPLYILYSVKVRQRDGTLKDVMKLTNIPPQPRLQGAHFFVFSTLENRRATLQVNGAALSADPLRLMPISGASLIVNGDGGKQLRATPRESANYILVLFDGVDSKMRWALVEMTS